MQSFRGLSEHFDLIPAAINRQLSEIDIARGRQEAFARQHPVALESLKQVALIESVEASNAIENITAPRKRLEELVAQSTTPRDRAEAEIAGYRAALGTIHASAESIPFTPNVVRQLHRDRYQFAARPGGNWKGTDNLVTEEQPDGSVAVRFTPVSALATPAAMEELQQRFGAAWEPTVTSDRGSKRELVKAFVRSNLGDTLTFADVKRAAPGVSDDYIRQVLRELRDTGIIEGIGAGRGARWQRLRDS